MDPGTPGSPLPTIPAPSAPPQTDSTAKLIYVLYLVTLAISAGLLSVIGVIMAYVNVGDAPEPYRSHYRFQIRTFWIAILYAVACGVLAVVVIGPFLLPLVAVWFVVRCAKGLQYLGRGQPYPNADTWLW
jgi:uncharacterized membrane protein